jgi:orotate phosphoribosyltransferase
MIAGHFAGQDIGMVAGPTTGGIILAHEVGKQMGLPAIYAEKQAEGRVFRRGLKLAPGTRVLVVDDVLTTGKSIRQVIAAVETQGGVVTGIGVLVDRSEGNLDFGVPLYSCLRTAAATYTPAECPQCAAGIPLVTPGSSQQK